MSFDDFNLYWKKHLIPGGLRAWRKKCSELIWKNEMLNSEFDWNRTLQFISNRNSNCCKSWEIEKEDVWERSYKIKNFLKELPTYEILYNKRDVNMIETDQCIRCKNGVENWDHLWICEKNELTIKEVIERSISDFEEHLLNEEKHEEVKLLQNMNFSFLKILYEKSEVLIGKDKYWELIRGVYNGKFNKVSKDKDEKELINELWVFCFNALKKEF
ncbi:hypothetical protein RhiirC2_717830 [Rhizophagus irregularis]|uniref:Reverse transcriptase zinc-binding domain-containing protein n=1 Tax=Rhizophagus irregularis TaxID=588596 RepID=A0A2N1MKV3_9GLOM|nr:hypothetical protein RhiirC2_717830 [Rhizophagus irregularis]